MEPFATGPWSRCHRGAAPRGAELPLSGRLCGTESTPPPPPYCCPYPCPYCTLTPSLGQALWDRIKTPAEERAAFPAAHPGTALATLAALETEIARLQARPRPPARPPSLPPSLRPKPAPKAPPRRALSFAAGAVLQEVKRAMMKEIIGDTRVMLREVWGAMCLTEDATKAFAPALEEVFTEEALAAHETHLAACRTKLEGMQPILKMVERREYIRTEEGGHEGAPPRPRALPAGLAQSVWRARMAHLASGLTT